MTLKILAAPRKGLFTLSPNASPAAPWQVERADFLADNVSMVLHDARSGRLYAALDHGHFGVKLHAADALGSAWTELPAPAYPPKPDDVNEVDMWGRPIPWSTARIWALETGGPDQPGVLWCGTLPGGLFKSTDHGASWHLVESLWHNPKRTKWMGGGADLPGIHSICVDPRHADTVRICVSSGGVWKTTDGGATWSNDNTGMWQDHAPEESRLDPNGQDAHRLVQCLSAPNRFWIQHHNGIFRSDDGGSVWHEVKDVAPSSFGFPVAVHPTDPDTAWFVPAVKDEKRIPADGKVVVTRTRDAGRSFAVLKNGLPQKDAYDLVYRHCLDVCATGDNLVFGSSTGGLWTSPDQGDTWHMAEARLPPIYATRFIDV